MHAENLSKQMNKAFPEKNVGNSKNIETPLPKYIETDMFSFIDRVATNFFW